MTDVKQNVTIAELVTALESLKGKEPKQKVRLEKPTLEALHEEVGNEEFLELLGNVILYSDKAGYNFIKLIELRTKL